MRVALCLFLLSSLAAAAPGGPPEAATTSAEDAAWICVVVPRDAADVLDEAHHRVSAELRAVGFEVTSVEPEVDSPIVPSSPPGACAGATGILVLAHAGTEVTISANVPGEDPLQQRMDLMASRASAEVIAIRAVEGLRAALIQSMRNRPSPSQESPAAVRNFTHLGSPPEEAQQLKEESVLLRPEEAKPGGGRRSRSPSKSGPQYPLLLGLGPSISSDGGSPGGAVELLVAWRPGLVSLGAVLDASLVAGVVGLPEGEVSVRQYSLAGRLALEVPCPEALVCQAGFSFGLRQLALDSAPDDPTVVAEAANHTSAALSGDLLGGYFFGDNFGVGGRVAAGALLNAPELVSSAGAETWGRPSIAVSLNVLGRF